MGIVTLFFSCQKDESTTKQITSNTTETASDRLNTYTICFNPNCPIEVDVIIYNYPSLTLAGSYYSSYCDNLSGCCGGLNLREGNSYVAYVKIRRVYCVNCDQESGCSVAFSLNKIGGSTCYSYNVTAPSGNSIYPNTCCPNDGGCCWSNLPAYYWTAC